MRSRAQFPRPHSGACRNPARARAGARAFLDTGSRRGAQRAFTYVGLLLAVALAGVALAAAGTLWSTTAKRDKEAELLFVGDQFRRAIGSYYEGTPGAKRYPLKLEDLLEDKRLVATRRHLRRIYVDPMTGQPDWELVRLPDGAIVGVHSRADGKPMKVANFAPSDESFANATSYRDWVFAYAPQGGGGAVKPTVPAQPGGAALSLTSPALGAPAKAATPRQAVSAGGSVE
ncbi:MAG TPA: type II secretion system protein [Burkholderiales bacterium]|nr:type II secretion system protein [Burkholderiales bacterium]